MDKPLPRWSTSKLLRIKAIFHQPFNRLCVQDWICSLLTAFKMSMCLLCTNFKGSDVWLTTFCTVNDMFCSLWNDIFKEQDNSNWKLTHTWWNRNLTLVAVQRQKCQTVQQVIKASTENSYERLSAGPEWLYFKGSTIALLTIHVSNVCMLILGVFSLLIMSGKQD